MRIGAIIQARTGSTRLPGKVLAPIEGFALLGWCVERLRRARTLSEVVVATSTTAGDDAVVRLGDELGFAVFRGSEEDVLGRFAAAAAAHRFDHIVRICGDSPFVAPVLVDELVGAYLDAGVDYASNVGERSYPRGLDAEVFRAAALAQAEAAATADYERAHVTPYFYQHPELFSILSVAAPQDFSHHRWCVDEAVDLEFVRALAARLGGRRDFVWTEALALVEADPELAAINVSIEQKKLEQG
jgi:spore coat polysaccharide biosynthesis protein SpsF (cytidylyltransferase family)